MHNESIIFSIFLIFSGAAVLATIALYARQAMIVAYLALGAILGPWGLGFVTDTHLINEISKIGIIFLLFLLGLNLTPQKLIELFSETFFVTLFSTTIFGVLAGICAWSFGFTGTDIILVGISASFSSTIIGLKLLPTSVLHHRHTGEIIISVLLLQDVIAIVSMLAFQGLGKGEAPLMDILIALACLPILASICWLGQKYILLQLFIKFDRIQEYIFLLTIGWCLGMAQLAETFSLSYEIGAFLAGVAIASSPIALHIAESLKPLRDFFLVMFFFGLGASFDFSAAFAVIIPASIIGLGLLVIKPVVFRFLLVKKSETNKLAWETGVRLGQMSEFSLLLVFVAAQANTVSDEAFYLIQMATILTFIVSAYWIVLRYPTPIALDDNLRRD